MFIDASALVAILTRETGWETLADKLDGAEGVITSAVAFWETIVRLMTKMEMTEAVARAKLNAFLSDSRATLVAIGEEEGRLATDAFNRFGKRRHAAALNMGDCFAYACAKARQVPLLYVGNDFAQTDVNDGFDTLN